MLRGHRKSAPKVNGGRVQTKNNWNRSPDYYTTPLPRMVVIDRKRPGVGYRHALTTRDIYRFLEILPDWDKLAVGLNAIVLAPGEQDSDGYHIPGVVHVCAWDSERWIEVEKRYFEEHQRLLERLGVPCEELSDGYVLCKFEDATVRDFQLLHILLHELGHHHDRMTTRSGKRAARGESYAENYANTHEAQIWEDYHRVFKR